MMERITTIAAVVAMLAVGCVSTGRAAENDINGGSLARPEFLQRGDTVAVCLVSSSVNAGKVRRGIEVLKSWGLHVKEAPNIYKSEYTYAGSVEERAAGLQQMIDDPSVKAIVMARGGYGASHILDRVDLTRGGAKWITGFSDVTAVFCALNKNGIEGLHAPMLTTIDYDTKSTEYMKQALFGEYQGFEFKTDAESNRGSFSGRLVGGNLSLIASEVGTPYEVDFDGAVLFFEDVDEETYGLDRMLTQLRLTGKLDGLKGVLIGEMTNCPENGNFSVKQIATRIFKDYGIPVVFGAPCGHDKVNYPLYIGRKVTVEVDDRVTKVKF